MQVQRPSVNLEELVAATDLGDPPNYLTDQRKNVYSWAYHRMETKCHHAGIQDEEAVRFACRLKGNRVADAAEAAKQV